MRWVVGGHGISLLRPCPGRIPGYGRFTWKKSHVWHQEDKILDSYSEHYLVFNGLLTVCWLLEVDIGVSKGTPGDHIPTDPDRENGSGWTEFLVQHGLGDVRMQVPDIQGSHGVTGSAGIHRLLAVEANSTTMSDDGRVLPVGKLKKKKLRRFKRARRSEWGTWPLTCQELLAFENDYCPLNLSHFFL